MFLVLGLTVFEARTFGKPDLLEANFQGLLGAHARIQGSWFM